MKRLSCALLVYMMLFAMGSCTETDVTSDDSVVLTFICHEENISAVLTEDEASRIIDILNSKTYDSDSFGVPSCGFSKDISLRVGNHTYAIAMDSCNIIRDCSNFKYYTVSKDDMAYIRKLFEKYGGYFPCV